MAIVIVNIPHAARVLRDYFGFVPNVDFVAGDTGVGSTGIDWLSASAMPSVAAIEAVTLSQLLEFTAKAAAVAAKAAANAAIDNGNDVAGDHLARLTRGLALVLLDELNRRALKVNAILDAVDGASSLATLKTAVAAISDEAQATPTQVLNAIKAQIAATAE